MRENNNVPCQSHTMPVSTWWCMWVAWTQHGTESFPCRPQGGLQAESWSPPCMKLMQWILGSGCCFWANEIKVLYSIFSDRATYDKWQHCIVRWCHLKVIWNPNMTAFSEGDHPWMSTSTLDILLGSICIYSMNSTECHPRALPYALPLPTISNAFSLSNFHILCNYYAVFLLPLPWLFIRPSYGKLLEEQSCSAFGGQNIYRDDDHAYARRAASGNACFSGAGHVLIRKPAVISSSELTHKSGPTAITIAVPNILEWWGDFQSCTFQFSGYVQDKHILLNWEQSWNLLYWMLEV